MEIRSLIIASVLVAGMQSAAWAKAGFETVEVTIRQEPGQTAEQLYDRIERAAVATCRTDAVRPYDRMRLERSCRRHFVAEAVIRFADPTLTAVHEAATDDPATGRDRALVEVD